MVKTVVESPGQRAGLLADPVIARCIELAQGDTAVELLWLYGSRAKGTARTASDYDFAVAFASFPGDAWDKRLQPVLLSQQWADALGVPDSCISVIDINHVPIPLAFSVIEQGVELVVKNPLRLAREESRISAMWEDNYLYRERKSGSGLSPSHA